MKKKGILYKLLLYISIPFILYFLYRFDFLRLKGISINYLWLSISLLLGWGGFILSAISWRYALHLHSIEITRKKAIASHGLSVFAKYIPGKIWVILGRASYITKDGYSLKDTSFISLKEQLIFILIGFLISYIPSFIYFNLNYITIILSITILGFFLVIFNGYTHTLTEKFLSFLFKKDFILPKISAMLAGKLSGFVLIYWIVWTLGFYTLIRALSPDVRLINAFAFPLSACYGLLAVIIPGGLGVREGVMVAFLSLSGMDTPLAVTVSIISRLWFMSGELFIFITALLCKNLKNEVK